jgi:pimeloyl-ACP methyl ester carboxylesterase
MEHYKDIEIRGARLAYREQGSGTQHIILVHANLSDIRSWDAIVPLLAASHHVVAYSRRYAWPNDPIEAESTDSWDEQAEDLAQLIKELEIGPCHIVGNSTGATLALLVAQRYPDLVRTLFLEEPPVVTLFLPRTPPTVLDVVTLLWRYPWAFLPTMKYGIFTIAATESSWKRGKDEEGLQTFLHGVVGTEFYHALSEARIQQARANMGPHKALFCNGSLPLITETDVRTIATPAYLFTAEKTPAAQKCINSLLARLLPNAQEVHFDGVSHFLHEDDPDGVAAAIVSRVRM